MQPTHILRLFIFLLSLQTFTLSAAADNSCPTKEETTAQGDNDKGSDADPLDTKEDLHPIEVVNNSEYDVAIVFRVGEEASWRIITKFCKRAATWVSAYQEDRLIYTKSGETQILYVPHAINGEIGAWRLSKEEAGKNALLLASTLCTIAPAAASAGIYTTACVTATGAASFAAPQAIKKAAELHPAGAAAVAFGMPAEAILNKGSERWPTSWTGICTLDQITQISVETAGPSIVISAIKKTTDY